MLDQGGSSTSFIHAHASMRLNIHAQYNCIEAQQHSFYAGVHTLNHHDVQDRLAIRSSSTSLHLVRGG